MVQLNKKKLFSVKNELILIFIYHSTQKSMRNSKIQFKNFSEIILELPELPEWQSLVKKKLKR